MIITALEFWLYFTLIEIRIIGMDTFNTLTQVWNIRSVSYFVALAYLLFHGNFTNGRPLNLDFKMKLADIFFSLISERHIVIEQYLTPVVSCLQ